MLAVFITLVLAAITATRNDIADFYAHSPRQHLEYWQKSANTSPENELAVEQWNWRV